MPPKGKRQQCGGQCSPGMKSGYDCCVDKFTRSSGNMTYGQAMDHCTTTSSKDECHDSCCDLPSYREAVSDNCGQEGSGSILKQGPRGGMFKIGEDGKKRYVKKGESFQNKSDFQKLTASTSESSPKPKRQPNKSK